MLDRYFLTAPALKELAAQNLSDNACQVQLITRAKMGTVAFMPPAFRKPGQRGRTRKKGDKVKLAGLFESKSNEFCQTQAAIYDQVCTVRYYSTDLLWGQGVYRKIRFVLVSYGKTRCILACTDLSLDPVPIIEGYSRRFKIEGTFRSLSQDVGAMAYRFWSKAVPRLNHFRKKADPDPLLSVTQENERKLVLGAVRASELYALASCVALGTLQILSRKIPREELRYQRTPPRGRVSEANVMGYLRRHLFAFLEKERCNPIPRFILVRQNLWGYGNS